LSGTAGSSTAHDSNPLGIFVDESMTYFVDESMTIKI